MEVQVEECRKLRRASATIRDAGVIWVKVPRHWPRATKKEVIHELVDRLERKDQREKSLLAKKAAKQELLTIRTREELEVYVHRINGETFQVPLGDIRLGNARYNHLAQVNLRTRTMTVSKYCLHEAPADALRYLIVHELAHYFEGGHGPAFWTLVERHVPDYRLQSRIIKAFHHQAVMYEALDGPWPHLQTAVIPKAPKPYAQPLPVYRPALPKSEPPALITPQQAAKPKPTKPAGNSKLGFGWFQQLLLWGSEASP